MEKILICVSSTTCHFSLHDLVVKILLMDVCKRSLDVQKQKDHRRRGHQKRQSLVPSVLVALVIGAACIRSIIILFSSHDLGRASP